MRIHLLLLAFLCSTAHADVLDRLRDDSGEVPGLPGWKLVRKPSKNHCGGIAVVTVRGKKKLTDEEKALAKVFEVTFPTGLNFAPGDKDRKVREASMKRFDGFLKTMTKVGGDARTYYENVVATEKTAEARTRSAARLAQITMRFASILARAEIPRDVRTGEFAAEKIEAFCDKLQEIAEPMVVNAEQAVEVCARTLTDAPAGWWTSVCAPPP